MKLKYYLRGIGIGVVVTSLILNITKPSVVAMSDEEIIAKAKDLGMIENVTLSQVSVNKATSMNSIDEKADISESENLTSESNDNITESTNAVTESENSIEESEVIVDDNEKSVDEKTDEESLILSVQKKKNLLPSLDTKERSDDFVALLEKEANEIPEFDEDSELIDLTSDENDSGEPDNGSVEETTEETTEDSSEEIVEESASTITITVIAGDSSYSAAKKIQAAGIVESAAEFDEYLCRNGYDKRLIIGSHKIPENASFEEIAKIITGKK